MAYLIHLYSKRHKISKVINLANATELGYDEYLDRIIVKYVSGEKCEIMTEEMLEGVEKNIFVEKLIDKIFTGSDNQILIDVDRILDNMHEQENISNSIK